MIEDHKMINEALLYEPHTGRLRWRHRPRHHFVSDGAMHTLNTRLAGGVAGTPSYLGIIVVVGKQRYQAHRVAWYLHYGHWPDKTMRHLDDDKCNNRIHNLAIRPGRN